MNYFCFLILGILSYPFLLLFHITFLLCFSFPLTDLFESDCFLVDPRQYLHFDFFSCKGCHFSFLLAVVFEPDCFLVDLRQYLYSDFFSCKGCLFLTVIKISNC